MIVDWQYEPIKGTLLHIDLKRIAMDKKLRVTVPIVLKGEAAGREDRRAASWNSCCAKWKSSACLATFRLTSMSTSPTLNSGRYSRVRSAARRRQDEVPDRREQPVAHVIVGEGNRGSDSGGRRRSCGCGDSG